MKLVFSLVFLSLFANAQIPASKNVWVITEENHSFEDVIGNPQMPYFNSLETKYGLSTQYYSPQHSSLTALMWLVAGQQVTTDNATTSCFGVNNLVRQLLQAGFSWRSYQEDLPYAGFQGLSSGNYVRRHNPLIDFKESCSSSQVNESVPYTQLQTNATTKRLPNFAYITPNTQNDAHDGTLSAADAWLGRQVPEILSLPAFQPGGDGLLFVVWDEGGLNDTDSRCSSRLKAGCGGRVATLVIGPQVRRNYRSSVLYTHANLLRTICDAMSLAQCPGAAALANPMSDFFNRVQINSPAEWNTALTSPVHVQATTNNDSKVYTVQVYVDDVLRKQVSGASIDTSLPLTSGTHHIVVQSWDIKGGIHKASQNVYVGASSLQILSPVPTATVESSVSVQVLGSANLRQIALSVDGMPGSQRASNALATTLSLKAGPHRLNFSGTLVTGGTISRQISVNVASDAVSITRPGTAAVPSPVEVRGVANDSVPVIDSQIYVDNVLRYETNGWGVDFPLNLTGGSHNITVQAWDAQGRTYKSSVSMSVLPIQINVSTPLAGSVHSPVVVSAVAQSTRVIAMQLYVDDGVKFQSSGSTLQTSIGLSIGPHRLVVQAWDENGGVWKKEVDVTSN